MLKSQKIKKVMLIFPTGKVIKGHFHHWELPMGLAYLAAVLRDTFDVRVLDGTAKSQRVVDRNSRWEYFGWMPEEIARAVREYAPDVVGVSCISSYHFPEVVDLCARVKKLDPNIITATGGTHPTFWAEDVLTRYPQIDFIALGEGEETFRELLLKISSGESYADMDGLAFRANGSCRINPKTRFIEDLDALPFPAVDLFPLDFYAKKSVPFSTVYKSKKNIPVVTSRGCTASCVFCASRNYWGRRYRARSPENVLDEIEHLSRRFGMKEVQFIDDNLTLDRERARRIFQGMMDRKLNMHWNAPNGIAIWTLDEEMLELMRASGCYELTVAFESGDQDVLQRIVKKPLKLKRAEELVRKARELNFQIHAYFITGFPGETKQQVMNTIAFARRIDLDSAYFFMANPTPGSDLYRICEEKGYIKKDFSFDDVDYRLAHIETPDFSASELRKLVTAEDNKLMLACFLRHPIRFLKRYGNVILNHPIMVLRTVFTDILHALGR